MPTTIRLEEVIDRVNNILTWLPTFTTALMNHLLELEKQVKANKEAITEKKGGD